MGWKKSKQRISHIIEYLLVLQINLLINLIPFRYLDNFSKMMVSLLLPFLPAARRRVYQNVSARYPDWTKDELEAFLRKNLRHSLRVSLEVFQSWKFRNPKFLKRHISAESTETIDTLIKRKRGAIVVEGHLGNWELPIIFYSMYGLEPAFSAKRLKNPYVDRVLEKRRLGYGGKIIYLHETLKFIKELRRGNVIGLVADQDAGKDGVFVEFLGRKASTYTGPALLTYNGKSDLYLAGCIWDRPGHYTVSIQLVQSVEESGKYADVEEAIPDITRKWSKALEKLVERYPEQYFWLHRRWKTRPPEEKDISKR